MILVDTPIIVAWLDPNHPAHAECTRALEGCAAVDELAISPITVAELAGSGRKRAALEEDLQGFIRMGLEEEEGFRAGQMFARLETRAHFAHQRVAALLVWAQASIRKVPILMMHQPNLRGLLGTNILVPEPKRASNRRVAQRAG